MPCRLRQGEGYGTCADEVYKCALVTNGMIPQPLPRLVFSNIAGLPYSLRYGTGSPSPRPLSWFSAPARCFPETRRTGKFGDCATGEALQKFSVPAFWFGSGTGSVASGQVPVRRCILQGWWGIFSSAWGALLSFLGIRKDRLPRGKRSLSK